LKRRTCFGSRKYGIYFEISLKTPVWGARWSARGSELVFCAVSVMANVSIAAASLREAGSLQRSCKGERTVYHVLYRSHSLFTNKHPHTNEPHLLTPTMAITRSKSMLWLGNSKSAGPLSRMPP
jgi:hypothetical protein